MRKVLVDTSVWIDALNGRRTSQVNMFEVLIDMGARIVVCPVIVQEILQGIKDDVQYSKVKENISGFEILAIDAMDGAYGAAELYRAIRKKGITIRKSNDCLIAYYAISHKATLLHSDEDFNKIAEYSDLKVVTEAE